MTAWSLVYEAYDPVEQGLREALTTLGNGYFCSRGAFPWAGPDDVNYPGTYLAGGYNRLTTEIAGRPIVNEDLVNMPSLAGLSFRPAGGDWFCLDKAEITAFRQVLDFSQGLLTVAVSCREAGGREIDLGLRKFVDMANPHMLGVELTITPKGWSGDIEVRSDLDARVTNWGVKRYRELNSRHLEPLDAGTFTGEFTGEEMIYLTAQTTPGRLLLGQAARTHFYRDGGAVPAAAKAVVEPGYVAQHFTVAVESGKTLTVQKIAAFYNAKDIALFEPGIAAQETIDRAREFDDRFKTHCAAWRMLWQRFDIEIEGDDRVQMILRLHIFHMLQTMSPHTVDMDVGVPARGWHGEAYRGHIFWDEIYVLPFLISRMPQIAGAMLRYRHNRLHTARQMAKESGLKGAMFPWQSGSDGREESQVMHLNPESGRWIPDNTYIQRHVSLAIAYNCWQHYVITGDHIFLESRGAEVILEVARFFASLAFKNDQGRYEIHGVMGPDEFHEGYPDHKEDEHGLNNNAYTNVMVAWLMTSALEALNVLDATLRAELVERLEIAEDEFTLWEDMSRHMKVPFHDGDIISQFEGYEHLREIDWDHYRAKYGNIQRLDRLLEAEGDSANRYKVSKQADVLMLFYLFSQAGLARLFDRLGYTLTDEMWTRNLEYYSARTSNGSTLSYLVHSWVTARTHPEEAWSNYLVALTSDVDDVQGGTTKEGIHLGLMVGTVDLMQRCFTGLTVDDGVLGFDPMLPSALKRLKLRLRYQGNWLDVVLDHEQLDIRVSETWPQNVKVSVKGALHKLAPGEAYAFKLASPQTVIVQ
ncbi:MAG: glycoside hydrolase family 65 protein [Rhodospirillaceae bacterium]|nr:glycoside hydrolase family 65 protein [Rhodospirillaceae bacterium]